ncbi:MAG TPA: phosphotransferase, partial [Methylibium sp.]
MGIRLGNVSHNPEQTQATISWQDEARRAAFEQWLATLTPARGLDAASLRPASADASFRRYFRTDAAAGPLVIMDAPPSQIACRPFVQMAELLRGAGLNAPEVLDWDEALGFMLLSDLGETTYLSHLGRLDPAQPQAARELYLDALAALVKLQGIA